MRQASTTYRHTRPALITPARNWPRLLAFLAVLGAFHHSLSTACFAAEGSAEAVDFNRDIRPILADKCFRCHGPDSGARQADLRLDREQTAKAEREGRRAIAPGQPDESELVKRITNEDEDERMPPLESGKSLSDTQIKLLTRWVAEGAVWSLPWAYVPPTRRATPAVRDASWPAGWVDNFVLARLEAEQLHPSADADKTTLIRRLSIDLVGLPPTPAAVADFLADNRPSAYESLVDRLLASPRFGERIATYWFDLTRYASTVGYHGDQDHWIAPYRDYVIAALNRNLPFDRFTREQLAGDLLPNPSVEQTIATGYNRMLQTSHEGGVQPKEYLAIYAADRVRNFSAVWMGGTMGCAQCHDHKFDPYTTKDFYAMEAFFADIDEAQHFSKGSNSLPTARPPELEILSDDEQASLVGLEGGLKELQAKLAKCAPDPQAADSAAKDAKAQAAAINKEIARYKKKIAAIHAGSTKSMITVAIEPRVIRILPRGNWLDDSGAVVQPAVPEFLGALNVGERRATRLDLANWLTDPQRGAGGPMARVMANRFWYLMFGHGLAASLDDFGAQGQPPVHPELLDALAVEFVESGWDTKHMLKLLAMSRAYRQTSIETPELRERDPNNQLFARQSRFRFAAETVRDSTLAVSGLLVESLGGASGLGGASAKPYQPAGYYRHLNFPEREYQADADERQWLRGVYLHWQRQFLHPMLKAFDAPSREECTAERPRSNTALAALVLLNDPTFVEAARVFAACILAEGGPTTDERLNFAFRRAVSRAANDDERAVLGTLLETSRQYYTQQPQAADQLLAVGLTPVPAGLDHVELAAWTIVARAILSMNEGLTRN